MYKYVDYTNEYGRIMQFGKNKKVPIHRWYPFVEGYAKEFIQSIIEEQKGNIVCLEPFSGSGTTSLELQNMDIPCYAFEVNPFMYLLSKVKLQAHKYNILEVNKCLNKIKNLFYELKNEDIEKSFTFSTLVKTVKIKKWNLNDDAYYAINKLIKSIEKNSSNIYKELFTIALSSILLDVSNLFRNGKCLSYKENWESSCLTQDDVYNKFSNMITDIFIEDIKDIKKSPQIDNSKTLYQGDCRQLIDEKIQDNSISLVITSPPYLNSRDYTDSYMLELKALGFVKNLNDISQLRKKTIRSHVQIKWENDFTIKNEVLSETLIELKKKESETEKTWNDSICVMVEAYFDDMKKLFSILYTKIVPNGKIYFNVSNSAYFGVTINTLEIIANIAEECGFKINEIRKARYIKSSPQQNKQVGKLLEGVIIIEKKEVSHE